MKLRLYLALVLLMAIATPGRAQDKTAEWRDGNAAVVQAFRAGDYAAALALARRMLALAEEAFGPEHPDTLVSVSSLGLLYLQMGRYREVEPLFRRALEASDRVLGPEHPDTLTRVNKLAGYYNETGRYEQAEPLFRRALVGRERALGPEHPHTLQSVNNLATLYSRIGRYREAEPLFRRTLEASERILGPEHPHTLTSANNLAVFYQSTGRYGEAEPLHRRTLEARERILGPAHPDTLTSVSNLAALYDSTGRHGEAEPLFRRALEARERILGPAHPGTLTSLNNLAGLYESTGRYGEAEPLYRRALEAFERALGPEHPDTLTSLSNLAGLYLETARYEEAQSLYRRALDARRSILGPAHPDTLNSLNNLAGLYDRTGRYEEAEPLYRRALEAFGQALGPEHPDTLTSLHNLAAFYAETERYGEAEPLYLRALEARRRVLGPEHPDTLTSLNNLAGLLVVQNRPIEAAAMLSNGVLASRLWAEQEADAASAAERRRAALEQAGASDALALALAALAPNAETAALAALVVLNRKGLVGEREAALLRLARTSEAEATRGIATELLTARRDLVAAFRRVSAGDADATAERIFQLTEARVDRLERNLALSDPTYRVPRDVTADAAAAALPARAVLIDFTLFKPFDPKRRAFAEDTNVGAVVLRPDADPAFVDLGPLAKIRPAIGNLSVTLGAGDRGKIAGRMLHRALLLPLESHLANAETLFIAPAGPLGLIPFDMLRRSASDETTLAASGPMIRLLATGRAVVAAAPEAPGRGIVAFGAVDYDRARQAPATPEKAEETILALAEAPRAARARVALRSNDRQHFEPLPRTATEIDAIARIWRENGLGSAALHVGTDAMETRLYELESAPRVLHLATHGFVRETEVPGARSALLTGVALAGANQAAGMDSAADGLLVGYEIEALDLAGAELVVVSACKTAQGRADATEGIYNLARSFRLAGADAVLVTLQPIDDELAAAFMEDFYHAWLDAPGATPAAALAKVKRAWARSPDRRTRHPSAWATFILIENRV